MDIKKSMFAALCGAFIMGLTGSVIIPSVANAAGTGTYKIALKRTNPASAIARDAILAKVRSEHNGRILSVQEKPSATSPDCNIVRMLTTAGELITVEVACDG